MLPNLSPTSLILFKKLSINKDDKIEKIINLIPRGSIIAIKFPQQQKIIWWRKFFDFPVFILTFGWVKLVNQELLVKRLIAYPGEKVEIRNKNIYLNDKLFLPDWLLKYKDIMIFPQQVSKRDNLEELFVENAVFVLSDNWDQNNDSRYFGTFSVEDIQGILYKVFLNKD